MRKGLLYFLKNQTTSKKFSELNTAITYVELASSLIPALCISQASTKGSVKFEKTS